MQAKILIIEDEPAILANLARFLRLEGFEVLTAADGAAGVELARSARPDLVLCDLLMPKLDGRAVLHELRAHAATHSLPLIYLTASAEPSEREARLDQGAADYLVKPVDLKDLLACVRRHLPAPRA
jgi:DNA-binding response OmpR family regulator